MKLIKSEYEVADVIKALNELSQDNCVPKNIKDKIDKTAFFLAEKCELSICIDRAKQEMDEIADDVNLPQFTRSQVWNISSMLEKLL